MKTNFGVALVGWLLLGLAGCGVSLDRAETSDSQAAFSDDQDPGLAALPSVPGELLAQTVPGADPEAVAEISRAVGAVLVGALPEIDLLVFEAPPDRFEEAAALLARSELVESVQKNHIFELTVLPDDPHFALQDHLGQIRAADAWELTTGSEDVIIAIVDSGLDRDHPDLADKIIDGWNVYDGNSDFADGLGHGTSVAGIAAADSNNGSGITGISWGSPLLGIRAVDPEGRSTARHLAAGILWAVSRGAKIINVSFAPLQSSSVIRSAVQHAFNQGALVFISAGNEGGFFETPGYPEALFIGATTATNEIAGFSDQGPFVDAVAPGVGVWSTQRSGGYGAASGTSFAAPVASGIAALAWSINPDLRPITIQRILTRSAMDLGTSGKDSTYGHGALDAFAAVQQAAATSFVDDTTPPVVRITGPAGGSGHSSRFVVNVDAGDDWGVADVVLFVDAAVVATDTRWPFVLLVDPSLFPVGTHDLTVVATDRAGNRSEPDTIAVTFGSSSGTAGDQVTSISFLSPANGSRVSGDVLIQARVSDADGLSTVEWLVDNDPIFVAAISGTTSNVAFRWQSGDYGSGQHTVSLIVTDAGGRRRSGELTLLRQ